MEISKNKKEKYKSLALKARKVLSEEEATSSNSNDEEYAMVVRDFKKFFRRRGKFVRQPHDDKKNFQKVKEGKKEKDDRRCFNEDDSKKEEICLMALDDDEVLFDTPYYSSSSLDNESWQNEYDKLCKISLRIINKNKQLRAKNEVLKREACELKTKIEQLERYKEISLECESCNNLKTKISSLTLKLASFKNSSSSLQEMLEMQKAPKDKHEIGYTDDIASTRNTKTKKLGPKISKIPSIEPALPVPSVREPTGSDEPNRLSAAKTKIAEKLGNDIVKKNDSVRLKVILEPDEWIKDSRCSRHMTGNKDLFSSYKTIDGGNVVFGGNTKRKIVGKDYLTKFNPKSTEGIFLRYSPNSKAYIILNKETMSVEESLNVKFDESPPPKSPPLEDDDVLECENVWICQISQEISQKRTRERMSDQEAKEIKAEAREIMPQPSTVYCS
ncbi:zf-CCHC domain-containing protein [Tanacetum coccineum]